MVCPANALHHPPEGPVAAVHPDGAGRVNDDDRPLTPQGVCADALQQHSFLKVTDSVVVEKSSKAGDIKRKLLALSVA